jgi:signal transduction histidine kinase/ligand-binding sensor domain-containing protein
MRRGSRDAVRRRYAAAVAALVIASLPAAAARAAGSKLDPSGAYAIRWWTVEDGLAAMSPVGVAVAADDAVWCVSQSHLMRFDGRRFDTLPAPVCDSIRRQIGNFRSIGVAPDGRLWLVCAKGAAVAMPTADIDRSMPGDWAVYRYSAGDFRGVAFPQAGRPLLYGMNTVVDFDGAKFVPHSLQRPRPPFDYLQAAIDRRTSDLWLWGYGGVRRIRSGVAHADDGPVAKRMTHLSAGDSGIWTGLIDLESHTVEGAAVYRDDAWHEYPMATKPSATNRAGKICEGPDGTVWLATHAAMHVLRDGSWRTILDGLNDFSLTTHRLTTDRRGVLWAACSGGLLSISRTSLQQAPLPPCGVVWTRRDGSLVAGIAGAVVRLAPAAGGKEGNSSRHDVIAALSAEVVPTAITEAADGTLFVGSRDSFVHVVRSGSSEMVTQTPKLLRELRNVTSLACDSANSVWAGTLAGLARYNRKRNCFDFVDPFPNNTLPPVLGLLAERDGSLLIAVQGQGIERLAADGSIAQEVPAPLMPGKRMVRFLRTPDQTLWAAGDTGLLRRDSSGHAALFDTRHGLAERAIVELAADDAGRLWLAFRDGYLQGIRINDLDDLAAGRRSFVRGIVLGPLDGLGDTELLGGLVHVPGRGLLATTSAGIVTVDPARLSVPDTASRPAITVEHRLVDVQSHFRWADVTTHEFDPPLYQTRLVGVDADWSLPARDTERMYASIPPGQHRFEVRHLRGDAVEDAPAGAVKITIPTPFWKTTWFLVAVGMGVAALAAAGGTAVSRALARRRIAELEREHERQRDRARIARDIHDGLGAGLAQMAMLSDIMRRSSTGESQARVGSNPQLDEALEEMFRSAQGLTRAVDEIVWAVNPANDTLQRLFTFLAHDVEELARTGDLELSIQVEGDVPDVGLPSTVRHHLCMLVREAVANVLKHARATTLDVALKCHGNAIDISIADDGCGFAPMAPARDGHDGLANMRVRVAELGGSLSIDSSPGCGTRVAIHVLLAAQAHVPLVRPRLRLAGDTDHDARRTG